MAIKKLDKKDAQQVQEIESILLSVVGELTHEGYKPGLIHMMLHKVVAKADTMVRFPEERALHVYRQFRAMEESDQNNRIEAVKVDDRMIMDAVAEA